MRRASLILVALTLGGCSHGIDGFYQKVSFDSTPAGAAVNVAVQDGAKRVPVPVDASCTTPCSLPILRDRSYVATFSKAGCTSAERSMIPTRMKSFFIPILPDSVTGNAYDLTPAAISASLACGAGT
jgi:hypothetical protein